MNDQKIQRIIDIIRSLKEEGMAVSGAPTNNASSGQISGLPPDSPPVFRKKYAKGGKGSRKFWLLHLSNKPKE